MPEELAQEIAAAAGGTLAAWRPVPGGDINEALQLELADGRRLFAKHRADPPPGFYAAEAAGLVWLADADALPVPRVVAVHEAFLALEWLDSAPRTADFDERLGEGLARLHRAGAARPGAAGGREPSTPDQAGEPQDGTDAAAPTFLGTVALPNEPAADWPAFYAQRRLAPLLRQAADSGAVDPATTRRVEAVIDRIDELAGPPEPPARLHGDLWSGNVMAGPDGGPVLVDPAAYGGHREVDLAMLELFGRPGPAFLTAYGAVHPLADGARERVALWQLVPLLVHAVLFGGGYGRAVDAAASRYVR